MPLYFGFGGSGRYGGGGYICTLCQMTATKFLPPPTHLTLTPWFIMHGFVNTDQCMLEGLGGGCRGDFQTIMPCTLAHHHNARHCGGRSLMEVEVPNLSHPICHRGCWGGGVVLGWRRWSGLNVDDWFKWLKAGSWRAPQPPPPLWVTPEQWERGLLTAQIKQRTLFIWKDTDSHWICLRNLKANIWMLTD